MSVTHILRITALSFTSGFVMALPSFAAEQGTYRPGNPYYSSQAGSAGTCESQCRGDAACKGWNFIKVSPQAASGVCEFNSTAVSPVPSSVSVSGDNGSLASSRQLSAGGTRTVRVGKPEAPGPVIPARSASNKPTTSKPGINLNTVRPGARAIRPDQANPQARPQRRVVRQPVPQSMTPSTVTHRSPDQNIRPPQYTRSQPPARPRLQHNLDVIPQRPQYSRPQNMQRPMPARSQHPVNSQVRQANPAMMNGGDPRLQRMVRQGPLPTRPAAQPLRAAPQRPPAPVAAAPNARPQRPLSAAEAEQSLFGSLHDDVKVPKPITAHEAANPDAPIATVKAVPTKPVTIENLLGLAGAPAR